VERAIEELKAMLPSFAMIDQGRTEDEQSCVWVEKGRFVGMGYISSHTDVTDMELLKSVLTPFPSNDYILNLILSHATSNPQKMLPIYFQAQHQ
jgi:DNA polymerase-3 subunit epsilon